MVYEAQAIGFERPARNRPLAAVTSSTRFGNAVREVKVAHQRL